MKKIFSIFILIIFLFSAMGVTINSHFCGKRLHSVCLIKKSCCEHESEMPKGCCKDEVKLIKIIDNYSPSTPAHIEKVDFTIVVLELPIASTMFSTFVRTFYLDHPPPPTIDDRVITFRSLLI